MIRGAHLAIDFGKAGTREGQKTLKNIEFSSMIIECPACSTRYDIKVELPPEGRTVRCAKCEHVWRATAIEEELYSAPEVGEPGEDEADRIGGGNEPGEASAGWDDGEEIPAFSHGYRRAPEIQEDEEPASDIPSFLAPHPESG